MGETSEMVLKTQTLVDKTRKDVRWAEDGGNKSAGMEVDANEEEGEQEEMARRMDEGKEGGVVFRRRMLERRLTPRWGSIIRPKKERRKGMKGQNLR